MQALYVFGRVNGKYSSELYESADRNTHFILLGPVQCPSSSTPQPTLFSHFRHSTILDYTLMHPCALHFPGQREVEANNVYKVVCFLL